MLNQENTQIDIRQDLHDARALLEQAGADDEKKKYRKAAEIILLKAIRLDPENEEARVLLQSVRGTPVSIATPAPAHAPAPPQAHPKPQAYLQPQAARDDELSFTVPTLFESVGKNKKKKSRRPKLFFGLVLAIAVGGGFLWKGQTRGMSPDRQAARESRRQTAPPSDTVLTLTQTSRSASATPVSLTSSVQPAAQPAETAHANAAPAAPAATAQTVASTPTASTLGKLAVSSVVAADIYQGDKHLGSTPMTLQLPAGRQTLEYRHGELKTVMVHDIKADETANASVTFQTTVQINAKPWAQVFLDGASRRALGQTPLSGITVPIGSVLVFENPNFTSKTHRVAENDAAIQVDFQ